MGCILTCKRGGIVHVLLITLAVKLVATDDTINIPGSCLPLQFTARYSGFDV